MASTQSSLPQGWDRTFLDLSSKMAEPFCSVWHLLCFRLIAPLDPTKFENCNTRIKEITVRSLIVASAILGGILSYSLPIPTLCSVGILGIGSRFFRALGFVIQKNGYTHVRGSAAEKVLDKRNPQLKVMNWNVCGIGGGLTLDHGGVTHWRFRLEGIVKKIKVEDPDVLILQEIYDTALAEALIEKLGQDYAHFFIHLGPNAMGSVGGCMVIAKCPVHNFSNTSFAINPWTINRSFATLEIKSSPEDSLPCARIIGTHLFHRRANTKLRQRQIDQIVKEVCQKTLKLPTILAGDLNIERDSEEGKNLSTYLVHGYQGKEPTASNQLVFQWDHKIRDRWGAMIDYISLFRSILPDGTSLPVAEEGISLSDCHLVKAFDDSYDTRTALSDHHGVSAIIRGLQRSKH